MATLGNIGKFNIPQKNRMNTKNMPNVDIFSGTVSYPAPIPQAPASSGPTVTADQPPTNAEPDLLAELANAIAGIGGSGSGRGGFRGSKGSSQAQVNQQIQQETDLLNATAANQKSLFGLTAESLQNKLTYAGQSYQDQLQQMAQQYQTSLFGQGAQAAATGATTSVGNRQGLSDLAAQYSLGKTEAGQKNVLATSQIQEAQKKAYANALLGNFKLGQAMDANATQRQEAGLAPQGWSWQ